MSVSFNNSDSRMRDLLSGDVFILEGDTALFTWLQKMSIRYVISYYQRLEPDQIRFLVKALITGRLPFG